MNSELSERLGLYLETSGLSQKELSRISGVSDSIICRVIKGENKLSAANLFKIANSTGVSADWLLGFGDAFEITYITPIETPEFTSQQKKYTKHATIKEIQSDCSDGLILYVTGGGCSSNQDSYYSIAMQYKATTIVIKGQNGRKTAAAAMLDGILHCVMRITRPTTVYIVSATALGLSREKKANAKTKSAILDYLESKSCSLVNVFYHGGAEKLRYYIDYCSQNYPCNPVNPNHASIHVDQDDNIKIVEE